MRMWAVNIKCVTFHCWRPCISKCLHLQKLSPYFHQFAENIYTNPAITLSVSKNCIKILIVDLGTSESRHTDAARDFVLSILLILKIIINMTDKGEIKSYNTLPTLTCFTLKGLCSLSYLELYLLLKLLSCFKIFLKFSLGSIFFIFQN